MAYDPTGLYCLANFGKVSLWLLRTADAVGDVVAAGYISDAGPTASGKGVAGRGMKLGDLVLVHVVSAGTLEAPTGLSDEGLYAVSAVNASTGAATIRAVGAT